MFVSFLGDVIEMSGFLGLNELGFFGRPEVKYHPETTNWSPLEELVGFKRKGESLPTMVFRDKATVDGQDPAPPRMMIIPLVIGFLYIPGGAGFLPSTVVRFTKRPRLNGRFIF